MIELFPDLKDNEFLSDEILIDSKNAVLAVNCKDYGIKPLPIKRNEGVKYGEQGIVGRLFLTNYRLCFKGCLKCSRMVGGTISMFHPSIIEIKNVSFLTSREIMIKSKLHEARFLLLGVGGFAPGINREKTLIKAINKAIGSFQESDNQKISNSIINNFDLIYSPFKVNKGINLFYRISTFFLHPEENHKDAINQTIKADYKSSSVINNNCVGIKFLEEYKEILNKTVHNNA